VSGVTQLAIEDISAIEKRKSQKALVETRLGSGVQGFE
jgi:hypothetical protein